MPKTWSSLPSTLIADSIFAKCEVSAESGVVVLRAYQVCRAWRTLISDDRLWKRVCDQMGFPRIGSKRRGKVINTCRPPFQRKLHQQPNPTFVADLVRLLLSANLFWMLRSW